MNKGKKTRKARARRRSPRRRTIVRAKAQRRSPSARQVVRVIKGGHGKPNRAGRWDKRIPRAGSVITKEHHGKMLRVRVSREQGSPLFLYEGAVYRSISAVARTIAGGTATNGFAFFDL